MYFLLSDLIHRFPYLKAGLAMILIWVGIKMALHNVLKVPTPLSLGVIIAVIAVAVLASLWKTRHEGRHAPEVETPAFFAKATPSDLAMLGKVWRWKQ